MMRLTKREKLFATEAALCAAFIAAIGDKWIAYAETAGWDILLVRKEDGFQIGIQAKLRLNIEVVNQAVESFYDVIRRGPDCRAVLVPEHEGNDLRNLAGYIGFTIINMQRPSEYRARQIFYPALPKRAGSAHQWNDWHEWCPVEREKLPEYIPDVVAGSPSPVQLTDWKICAIKIAVTLDKRGHVTRYDFKHIGIDHRRWIARENQWLVTDGGVYIRGKYFPNLKKQHPVVYKQITAEFDKWSAPALPKQDRML